MALIKTNTGRTVFKKAESMIIVPYNYDSGIQDYVVDAKFYDISAIIGDSIVIEQSEGTTETKENEFVNKPIIQSASGSKYGFTAQCLDLQNKILKAVFGAMIGIGDNGEVEGLAAFYDDSFLRYALIRIGFGDDTPSLVMPKVQLNSKLFIQQLRTRVGQGNLSGTATPFNIAIADKDAYGKLIEFPIYHGVGAESQYIMGNARTYIPNTPVLFIPKGYNLFVQYGQTKTFGNVNFSAGSIMYNVSVDYTYGTWSNTRA